SLQKKIKPGEFVVIDQFIDRTKNRKDTFYDGPITTHISGANPYCPILQKTAYDTIWAQKISGHNGGTAVVISGPRFSSKAESQWFSKMGWDVVNMTQYPDMVLARELEMCYCGIALITDYDIGVDGVEPVSVEDMLAIFQQNMEKIKTVIFEMVDTIDTSTPCSCHSALQGARFND
ncbi:MAG: MTAP family purine nucleoside phosphorylase, partial [Candidatus Margulisbacteria bacterium]|nr:MTAP family purine nucleoside phosphorylase [Candidatus Margulisiibacteriota bacterium]